MDDLNKVEMKPHAGNCTNTDELSLEQSEKNIHGVFPRKNRGRLFVRNN
jgi:hypothetical protein